MSWFLCEGNIRAVYIGQVNHNPWVCIISTRRKTCETVNVVYQNTRRSIKYISWGWSGHQILQLDTWTPALSYAKILSKLIWGMVAEISDPPKLNTPEVGCTLSMTNICLFPSAMPSVLHKKNNWYKAKNGEKKYSFIVLKWSSGLVRVLCESRDLLSAERWSGGLIRYC